MTEDGENHVIYIPAYFYMITNYREKIIIKDDPVMNNVKIFLEFQFYSGGYGNLPYDEISNPEFNHL